MGLVITGDILNGLWEQCLSRNHTINDTSVRSILPALHALRPEVQSSTDGSGAYSITANMQPTGFQGAAMYVFTIGNEGLGPKVHSSTDIVSILECTCPY